MHTYKLFEGNNYSRSTLSHLNNMCTVEPPIVDPPTKGHNINDLSINDTGQGPKNLFPIVLIHLESPTRGQPLYKGHNS